MLGGANVELDFRYGALVVAYSHGWSLDLEGGAITGEQARQGVSLHLPYSTGLGVGLSHWLEPLHAFVEARVEAKLHRFEASYGTDGSASRTEIARYSTVTLGGGLYFTYLPFASRTDVLRGLNLSLSGRLWPKIASTLDDDRVSYASGRTGQTEVHQAANIGIADTPLIVNVSIGYVFQ